jgi:hypothetical protein
MARYLYSEFTVRVKTRFTVHTAKDGRRYLTHNRRAACEIVQNVDGRFMILVDGLQYGGQRDASGAGDKVFASFRNAVQYFQERELAGWNAA